MNKLHENIITVTPNVKQQNQNSLHYSIYTHFQKLYNHWLGMLELRLCCVYKKREQGKIWQVVSLSCVRRFIFPLWKLLFIEVVMFIEVEMYTILTERIQK